MTPVFNITADLAYTVAGPGTAILNLQVLRSGLQHVQTESLTTDPEFPVHEFGGASAENRFVLLRFPSPCEVAIQYRATVQTRPATLPVSSLPTRPVTALTRAEIPFLLPSRYCQSDKIGRLAWSKFGQIEEPLARVRAICDWIHENVIYLRGSTHASTSACDTLLERAGVCRDFAHLGIALCRALNIPARYVTGYACGLVPPDLHAWFEVSIGGVWITFDATRLAPPNGLVRVGYGRDAADAAVATAFGPLQFKSLVVSCVAGEGAAFEPWPAEGGEGVVVLAEEHAS